MKFKFSKFPFRLKIFLRILFVVILILELAALANTLFLHPRSAALLTVSTQGAAQNFSIDLDEFTKVYNWVQDKNGFALPDYDLKNGLSGRDNPFADYK